tara:strand:- start:11139 stop:11948 length:810 start_codon:yes stop_codon:yes gene_type:complete
MPTTSDAGNKSVFAAQAQLNYTPNIAPVRLLGDAPNNDNFNLAGPPNASLSFQCYVDNSEFDPTDYTGDVGDDGTTFRIGNTAGGISGSGLFMTAFSYTLSPYQPVLVQCDFAIYNPLALSSAQGKLVALTSSPLDATNFANYGHGAYSNFSGNGSSASATLGSDISIFDSVQYSYSAQRLPNYTMGTVSVTNVELVTAEQSVTIQGNNIMQLVDFTGVNPGLLNIQVKNSQNQTCFETPVDGRVVAENVSLQAGDVGRGSVTITELLK